MNMQWLDELSERSALCALALSVGAGLLGGVLLYTRRRLRSLRPVDIRVVTTPEQCDVVIKELKTRCAQHTAVGFDCEWVTVSGRRQPVSLLQLATRDGLCGLFRLSVMNEVPKSLKNFLENDSLYKLGVGAIDDSKYLAKDYGVNMKGTLDIRHIACNNGFQPGGLDTLARTHLRVGLDKHWKVRASDWEAKVLSDRQILYAANDAYVAVKIVEKLLQSHYSILTPFRQTEAVWKNIGQQYCQYADLPFSAKSNITTSIQVKNRAREKKYTAKPRATPLYQNAIMLAPDGELLCTCDVKKGQWYIDKGLAELVTAAPYTVRLRFEPAGRAVGEVGRYYQLEKRNACVVCGEGDSYMRKNVVPREYRKYFPDVMKDHSSHDVVLLCISCHQRSNASDLAVRQRLAATCYAPLAQEKYAEDMIAKTVRSAARALLQDRRHHNLPPERRTQLEQSLLQHYPGATITDELLSEASNVQVLHESASYAAHGARVVEWFARDGSLLALERMWREHFLQHMRPRHLPELWSVHHNQERLMIRVQEGRIDPADMKLIGLSVE